MKKIFVLFLLVYSMASMAITVDDFNNVCGLYAYDNMYATFAPDSYSCESGKFLPANGLGCANCLAGFSCAGGTFDFNEYSDQGLVLLGTNYTINENNVCAVSFPKNLNAKFEPNQYTCNAGYYLPADGIECVQCTLNNACVGGTYAFNETTDQGIVACASGTFSPTGSTVCYPHIFHVGDDVVYLKTTKQTTPSLNVKIGNDIFYANMTTVRTKMNKDSDHYFHVQWPDNDYYICDDTTCPQ